MCIVRKESSAQKFAKDWKGAEREWEKKFAQLELRFKMLRDSKHYCLQRVQIYNKMLLLYNMYSDYNQLVFELVARQQRINRGVYLCLIFEISI